MDTREVDLDQIAKYVNYVDNIYKIDRVILFGSYANKTATENSDVDIAIISKQFGARPLIETMELYKMRHGAGVEIDIQPHPFGLDEFNTMDNFFIAEITKTGIDITNEVLYADRQGRAEIAEDS